MRNIHPVLKTELYKQACAIIKSGKPVELFSEKTECVYVTCYRNSVKEVFKNAYDEGEPITRVRIATDASITHWKNVYYVYSHVFYSHFGGAIFQGTFEECADFCKRMNWSFSGEKMGTE